MKRMKTLLVSVIIFIIIATASVTLFGCKNDQLLTFAKAYNYSAIAGIGVLETEVNKERASGYSVQKTELDATQKEIIISNLAVAQNLANNGIVKTENVESDREGYEVSYVIKATDYSGVEKEYKFYYNQTDVTEQDDLKENEKEYKLEGLVVVDDVEYRMFGEQEVENNETEFSFRISVDENNYVIIEQETETNEMEFQYTAYKNGIKVFETEVEYEINRKGDVELQFEIFDKENNISKEYVYEFYDNGGEKFAKIKIKNGKNLEVLTTVKIVDTANGVEYVFVE